MDFSVAYVCALPPVLRSQSRMQLSLHATIMRGLQNDFKEAVMMPATSVWEEATGDIARQNTFSPSMNVALT